MNRQQDAGRDHRDRYADERDAGDEQDEAGVLF